MTRKPASLTRIEERLESVGDDPLRQSVLIKAKNFKTSWIELGQALHEVHRDRLFKKWGYSSFEVYTAKEIGLRKDTAVKLLRSYYFLEREEPNYLEQDYRKSCSTSRIPSFEAVDVLRLAKNRKDLDEGEYTSIRQDVLEKGKDHREIKKGLTALIKQRREELNPDDARQKKRTTVIKRFLGTLRATKHEMEALNLLPKSTLTQINALIHKIEEQL